MPSHATSFDDIAPRTAAQQEMEAHESPFLQLLTFKKISVEQLSRNWNCDLNMTQYWNLNAIYRRPELVDDVTSGRNVMSIMVVVGAGSFLCMSFKIFDKRPTKQNMTLLFGGLCDPTQGHMIREPFSTRSPLSWVSQNAASLKLNKKPSEATL